MDLVQRLSSPSNETYLNNKIEFNIFAKASVIFDYHKINDRLFRENFGKSRGDEGMKCLFVVFIIIKSL